MKRSNIDISGRTYNKLTAVSFFEKDKHNNDIWKCLCACGEYSYVRKGALTSKIIKQCSRCGNKAKEKYFIKNDRIKSIFQDMKRRCYEPSLQNYDRYGGRGIKIYQAWLDKPWLFENWAIENGYKDNLTIDRINNDGDYKPSNCRWADYYTQANNRSNNRILEYDGIYLSINEWADKLGVDTSTMYNRINSGEEESVIFNPTDIRQQKSKSGINGISWHKRSEKWLVRLLHENKRVCVGYYKSLDNAKYAKNIYESKRIKLKEEEIKRQMNK